MRLQLLILTTMLLCVFQVSATSTVSGFAVAPRWMTDLGDCGGFGKLMRYDIANGVTTKTTVIFDGLAHYAAINPDGRRLAFFAQVSRNGYLYPSSIVVMNPAGGSLDTIVTGLVDSYSRSFCDWPDGDWIYYGLGNPSSDGSFNAVYSSGGILEFWKVNVKTKQTVKVCSFLNGSGAQPIWQAGVSNDGLKAIVRPRQPLDGGFFGFKFSDYPSGVVSLAYGNSIQKSAYGCGASISPSGNYTMFLTGTDHQEIQFQKWDNTVLTKIRSYDINSYRTPGTPYLVDTLSSDAGGMDNNRWSCNDDKWVCLCVGWAGRGGDGGSNQVLLNWMDHEIVRTSNDTECSPDYAYTDPSKGRYQNETGDFWVGNPTAVLPQAAKPAVNPNGVTPNAAITVFDMLGRQIKISSRSLAWDGATLSGISLKRGVYFVQVGSGTAVQTRKLVIQK
jgi:hypothetical protein